MKFKYFHEAGNTAYTKYTFWLLLFFFPSLPCQAFSGKYPVHNFRPSDYKAGIQNIDFAQNRDMTLFVANNLGILSYNGKAWEKHALQTGKKQRAVECGGGERNGGERPCSRGAVLSSLR